MTLVRQQRKQLALNQLDLAGLGNTGNRFIVELERGKPTLQLQKVLQVMDLLGLEMVVRRKIPARAVRRGPRPPHLEVFFGEEPVGVLHDTSPLAFEYAASWGEPRRAHAAVSAVPLAPGLQSSAAVQAFFENLLPEGELRHYIAEQKKASTLFSMLLEVAGYTAGGFVILPAGQSPEPPSYQPTTWEALHATLKRKSASAIDITRRARPHLAGRRPGQKRPSPFSTKASHCCRKARPPPPTSSSPTSAGWPKRGGSWRRTKR